jgi:hypothetical protein
MAKLTSREEHSPPFREECVAQDYSRELGLLRRIVRGIEKRPISPAHAQVIRANCRYDVTGRREIVAGLNVEDLHVRFRDVRPDG